MTCSAFNCLRASTVPSPLEKRDPRAVIRTVTNKHDENDARRRTYKINKTSKTSKCGTLLNELAAIMVKAALRVWHIDNKPRDKKLVL